MANGKILLDLVSITIKNGTSFRKCVFATHRQCSGFLVLPSDVVFMSHSSANMFVLPTHLSLDAGNDHRFSDFVSQVLARPSEWLELFKAPRKRGAFFSSSAHRGEGGRTRIATTFASIHSTARFRQPVSEAQVGRDLPGIDARIVHTEARADQFAQAAVRPRIARKAMLFRRTA